jgi:ABC-2 type transport system ATP-binding protein
VPTMTLQRLCLTGHVTAALSLVGLGKSFGPKRAVDHLDLEVRRGCMFGLVGPNGAGKTTTLSMATGLLRPAAA